MAEQAAGEPIEARVAEFLALEKALVEEPEAEVYVWSLPGCCLRSLKEAALAEAGERRLLFLPLSCMDVSESGKAWSGGR